MPERIFSKSDLCYLIKNASELSIYALSKKKPDPRFTATSAAIDETGLWHRDVTSDEQIPIALSLRQTPRVESIAIIESSASNDCLPVVFSQYLTELRAKNKGMFLPCIISNTHPDLPKSYVCVPHLVAYCSDNTVTDRIMWEVLTTAEAEQWLGTTLPNQEVIEQHLPKLLTFRSMIRARQNVPNEAYRKLTAALANEDRYPSILFVYQHQNLFQALFDEWTTIQEQHDILE